MVKTDRQVLRGDKVKSVFKDRLEFRGLLPTRALRDHAVCKVCRASDCKGSKAKKAIEGFQESMGSMVRTVDEELMVSTASMAFRAQRVREAWLDRTPSDETVRREKKAPRGIGAALVLLGVLVLLEVQVLLEAQEPQGLSDLLGAMAPTVRMVLKGCKETLEFKDPRAVVGLKAILLLRPLLLLPQPLLPPLLQPPPWPQRPSRGQVLRVLRVFRVLRVLRVLKGLREGKAIKVQLVQKATHELVQLEKQVQRDLLE